MRILPCFPSMECPRHSLIHQLCFLIRDSTILAALEDALGIVLISGLVVDDAAGAGAHQMGGAAAAAAGGGDTPRTRRSSGAGIAARTRSHQDRPAPATDVVLTDGREEQTEQLAVDYAADVITSIAAGLSASHDKGRGVTYVYLTLTRIMHVCPLYIIIHHLNHSILPCLSLSRFSVQVGPGSQAPP